MLLPTQTNVLKFWIPGRVVPKARPRFNGSQAYLPSGYRGWRSAAYLEVLSQLTNQTKTLPIQKAAVEIQLVGQRQGDLDNVLGSCLDLLVQSQVIIDDRISCIPEMSIKSVPGEPVGVKIKVVTLD